MKSPYFFGEKTELEKGKYKTSEKHFIMSKRKEVPLLPPQKKKKSKTRKKGRKGGRQGGKKRGGIYQKDTGANLNRSVVKPRTI